MKMDITNGLNNCKVYAYLHGRKNLYIQTVWKIVKNIVKNKTMNLWTMTVIYGSYRLMTVSFMRSKNERNKHI